MKTVKVRLDSSEKLIWEGEATSVSSANSKGPFDILPYHASFITLIEKETVIVRPPKSKELRFNLERAVIYNRDNLVSIYTI